MRVALLFGALGFLLWLTPNAWLFLHFSSLGLFGLVLLLPFVALIGSIVGGKGGALAMMVGGLGSFFITLSYLGLFENSGGPRGGDFFSPLVLSYLFTTFMFLIGAIFAFRERKNTSEPSGA